MSNHTKTAAGKSGIRAAIDEYIYQYGNSWRIAANGVGIPLGVFGAAVGVALALQHFYTEQPKPAAAIVPPAPAASVRGIAPGANPKIAP